MGITKWLKLGVRVRRVEGMVAELIFEVMNYCIVKITRDMRNSMALSRRLWDLLTQQ